MVILAESLDYHMFSIPFSVIHFSKMNVGACTWLLMVCDVTCYLVPLLTQCVLLFTFIEYFHFVRKGLQKYYDI